jgi:hypothetical protein
MTPSSSVGSTVAVAVEPVVALVQCLRQSIAVVELESVWELVTPPPAESQLAEVTYQPAELTCHQPAVASDHFKHTIKEDTSTAHSIYHLHMGKWKGLRFRVLNGFCHTIQHILR